MSTDPRIQAVYDRALQDDIRIHLYTPHIVDILAAADVVDPLRQPGMVTVDTNDEAELLSVLTAALAYLRGDGDDDEA